MRDKYIHWPSMPATIAISLELFWEWQDFMTTLSDFYCQIISLYLEVIIISNTGPLFKGQETTKASETKSDMHKCNCSYSWIQFFFFLKTVTCYFPYILILLGCGYIISMFQLLARKLWHIFNRNQRNI